eukprot:5400651-Pleurochrysis_carterae.AAC.2
MIFSMYQGSEVVLFSTSSTEALQIAKQAERHAEPHVVMSRVAMSFMGNAQGFRVRGGIRLPDSRQKLCDSTRRRQATAPRTG